MSASPIDPLFVFSKNEEEAIEQMYRIVEDFAAKWDLDITRGARVVPLIQWDEAGLTKEVGDQFIKAVDAANSETLREVAYELLYIAEIMIQKARYLENFNGGHPLDMQ